MMKYIAFAILFAATLSLRAQAETLVFTNNTNQEVDYVLLHADPGIKTEGKVDPNGRFTKDNLQGFGDRAIIVWSKDRRLLYAGKATMTKGNNLLLTLSRRAANSGSANGFYYQVGVAASRFQQELKQLNRN